MVTIKQIAEQAGVSTATVSNVIHGKSKHVSAETVRRIQALIDEMGYIREAGRQSHTRADTCLVATILRYQSGFENLVLATPFYGIVAGTIEEELRLRGCYMMLYASSDMDDILKMLMTWDVDGIITVSSSVEECQKIHEMTRKPMVSIDTFGAEGAVPPVPDVGLDDEGGGQMMVSHLLECGYETIFVAGLKNYGIEHRRWIGAQRAAESPLFSEGKRKLEFLDLGHEYSMRKTCYDLVIQQLPFKRKTAFFFTSDDLAMEAIRYWSDHGIQIPRDLGVAGFDNSVNAITYSIPPLTTINQDIRMKGRIAVEELVTAIKDPSYTPKSHVLPVSLISRHSV